MTVLPELEDGIRGERITCFFRKRTKDVLVIGTHRHRARKIVISGIPSEAWITKPFRFKG
ncbi:MAG: hypothetical protein ISS48_02350 [Candidatus Aenigmarchaeota archaeon]|nr:hypothetical protein [Candidatus Aenigmarchaeota archaeon]